MSTELELATWRRSVGELYAAVRAEDDPQRGHALWRHGRDELFRSHPQSSLLPGDPLRVTGLPYWPYDPQLRFDVPLLHADQDLSLSVPTSEGATPMTRLGRVHLPAPVDAVIDLNFLYHPSCRYNDAWLCPLAPPGNTISTRVSAGERLPAADG